MPLEIDLRGRRAAVTGGGGALGAVIGDALAAAGAEVVVVDLAADRAETVSQRIRADGGSAHPLAVDLADADAVSQAFADVERAIGPIDVLVNGAGGGAVSPFVDTSAELWRSQMTRNLDTVFSATRAVLPGMLERRSGRIISIASIAAVSGGRLVRGATAYATAKAGVIGLTKALAIEVAEQGVTVNAIAPGAQATPGRDRDSATQREALLAQIPTRRLGEPQHLAALIAFLASDAAANITGVVLPTDGGHSI